MTEPVLPTFLIIGARKSATSSLHKALSRHPDFCMSQPKEPCFFSHEGPYRRGIGWYSGLFKDPERPFRGESSVDYGVPTRYPRVIPGIKAWLPPDTRFVFVARHPIRRLESEWRMHNPIGRYGDAPFDVAIDRYGLLETSLYFKQLSQYVDAFGRDRIHVCTYEDLISDPSRVVSECLVFLGADPSKAPDRELPHELDSNRRTAHRLSFMRKLARKKWFKQVRGQVPESIQDLMRSVLKKPANSAIPWNRSLHDRVTETVSADAARFLSSFGLPESTWSFERWDDRRIRA
ncbi:MAG: sulfotransferase [Deltaproteobacteria bacterium]|nr:sulfotransferase [Deltaproteobacteria bacterium]